MYKYSAANKCSGLIMNAAGRFTTCNTGATCNFYGGSGNSGQANGGPANGSTPYSPNINCGMPFDLIDGIPCYDMRYHMGTQIHFHTHIDIFFNGVNLMIPRNIGIIQDKCFYALHTHNDDGILHIESQTNGSFVLGMFFDIWGKQFNDAIRALGNPPITKAYVNGIEVNSAYYRQIPLRSLEEIVLVYGSPPETIPSNYEWPSGYGI